MEPDDKEAFLRGPDVPLGYDCQGPPQEAGCLESGKREAEKAGKEEREERKRAGARGILPI